MTYYRISKYDPRFRKNGIYQKDEWTSYSDIGKVFSGAKLHLEDYLEVEERYIRCIQEILSACGIGKLRIWELELYDAALPWKNGQKVDTPAMGQLLRHGLREWCWAILAENAFRLEFGYEYYLHIGCSLPPDEIEKLAMKYELFVEPWEPFPRSKLLRFRLNWKVF